MIEQLRRSARNTSGCLVETGCMLTIAFIIGTVFVAFILPTLLIIAAALGAWWLVKFLVEKIRD